MKYVVTLLCMVLFIACKKSHNEISKVEFARSGAWSDFGAAIIVDSSLNYKYCDDNLRHGNFIGKVDKDFWNNLTMKLENSQYKTVDSVANMHAYDAEYFELIIHWGNNKKRIVRLGSVKPDSILRICYWLDKSYKNITLHPTNDPIKFEGEFQKAPRPPIRDK